MTRNQKIAIGCGGAGCLGLIVVGIACVLIYYFFFYGPAPYRDSNFNTSTNRNSNSNDNSDITTNSNDNDNDNSSNTILRQFDDSMSDDDKHKLYHASFVTGDEELIRRVSVKLGLMNDDYSPVRTWRSFLHHMRCGRSVIASSFKR